MDDRASVEAFMADFNARPIAERDVILGPGLPPRSRSVSPHCLPRPLNTYRCDSLRNKYTVTQPNS